MMITTQALIAQFKQALEEHWGYIWGTAGETWTAEKQRALEKTTDEDRAQGRKYGSKWIGHTVADCSGLFSWAFRKLGGTMYHGSDTMYRKCCVNKGELKKGRRTDSATLKPGTAVFVWNGKKYSHVGLYVGDGTVIEAMGTVSGVTTTKVTASKWTHWGELNGVDYNSEFHDCRDQSSNGNSDGCNVAAVTQIGDLDSSSTIQNADPPAGGSYGVIPTGAEGGAEESLSGGKHPTLRKGDKGEAVREMQTMLDKLGYDLGSYGADGDFGSATEAAVKSFQSDHGLTVDGIVGKNTWAELINSELHDRRDQSSNGKSDGCNVAAVTQIGDLDSSSTIQNADPPAGGGEAPAGSAQTYSVTISGLDLTQARALQGHYPGSVIEKEVG